MKTLKTLSQLFVFSFIISIILFSCSATNYLTMSVVEPAPVYMPKAVQKVGILNRTMPDDKSGKVLDDIDKILSLEGKDFDKKGAAEEIKGLMQELKSMERFSAIEDMGSQGVNNPGLGLFPAPLSWDKVEELCKKGNVDALYVLEFYDTHTKINYSSRNVEVVGPLGVKVPAIEHKAEVVTSIKSGWRIYYPAEKMILDEYAVNGGVVSVGTGINPLKAIEAIAGRGAKVRKESFAIGRDYAPRILPYKIRVSRTYYVRGTENFKIGKRRAQTGDWDGAAVLWKKETTNPKRKVAGRAHYNMAISNEINGNLEEAVNWAQKAYTDYKDKRALRYLNILRYRIEQRERLKAQEE